MKIILILVFLLIALVALVFSLLNFQPVEINLYFTTISLPLAIALTIELFAGIGIGLLAAFFQIIKLKSQYTKLNKKLVK
jgi:putative membrane protein